MNDKNFPFQILGTSDDGMLCFLDRGGRFVQRQPTGLNKDFMQTLAPLAWWHEYYRHIRASEKTKDPVDWDMARDDILHISDRSFDFSNTKGLGAWRSPDGKICFHSGETKKIMGEHPKEWVFIRKANRNVGLGSKYTDKAVRQEILLTAQNLLFETWQDAVRLLGWATLAVFSGALPWRPAVLITGPSGGGKSELVRLIVKPLLGMFRIFASGSSTEPGIRQRTAVDALPVIVEESEADTPRERENRENVFKLMRQSTSDDTPEILKGGKDGTSQSYNLKSMFLFVGISPQVEKEADENRISFCNIKSAPKGGDPNWGKNRDTLERLMTEENMAGIRSLVWDKLPKIIETTNWFEKIIQDVTGLPARTARKEAPIIAVYILIWLGIDKPKKEEVVSIVKRFYDGYTYEKRDETAEMVERILDIPVPIFETREQHTIKEMLLMLKTGERLGDHDSQLDKDLNNKEKNLIRQALFHCGVAMATDKFKDGIGIAKNHDFIMRKLGVGRGYHKQLFRHDKCANQSYPITVNSIQRGYVILEGMV
jgi:hypothetical protein